MKTVEQALDEAYKNAGSNAYFGNGFRAGVEFANELIESEVDLPEKFTRVLVKFEPYEKNYLKYALYKNSQTDIKCGYLTLVCITKLKALSGNI